jgi:NAD(P)-dependent dehydrogenase (short-subunit alcohol dehydrogenase family)
MVGKITQGQSQPARPSRPDPVIEPHTLAVELAAHFIRVNTVNPTFVRTDMMRNDSMISVFVPHEERPAQEQFENATQTINVMPLAWIPPEDISRTVLYLASDDSRYVTGTTALIDLGAAQAW